MELIDLPHTDILPADKAPVTSWRVFPCPRSIARRRWAAPVAAAAAPTPSCGTRHDATSHCLQPITHLKCFIGYPSLVAQAKVADAISATSVLHDLSPRPFTGPEPFVRLLQILTPAHVGHPFLPDPHNVSLWAPDSRSVNTSPWHYTRMCLVPIFARVTNVLLYDVCAEES
ncbi:hypothetical protein J6590_099516 [Homalodisca vitripennis]|nr:hypothetical protein J6590_099516 [Homalodisca vitripennis]